jgi:hypothetical protein
MGGPMGQIPKNNMNMQG